MKENTQAARLPMTKPPDYKNSTHSFSTEKDCIAIQFPNQRSSGNKPITLFEHLISESLQQVPNVLFAILFLCIETIAAANLCSNCTSSLKKSNGKKDSQFND